MCPDLNHNTICIAIYRECYKIKTLENIKVPNETKISYLNELLKLLGMLI